MASSTRMKKVLVLTLSALAIYTGVLNLAERMGWEQPWDGLAWAQTGRGVEAKLVLDPSAAGPQAGLAEGDLLVRINEIPIRSLDEYTEVLEALSQVLAPAGQATYVVKKAGTEIEAHYPVEIRLKSPLDHSDLFLILVAFTYLGIGLFIYLRNWKASGAFHFYLICLVSFVLYLYRHSGRADSFDILVYWLSALAFLLLPPLFLHFCLYFPEPLALLRDFSRLKTILYAPFVFLAGMHAAWFSGLLAPAGFPRNHVLGHFFDRVHLVHFLVFFLLGAAALVFAGRQAGSAVERQQMKWISRGALVGILPFTCLYALPYLLGWRIYLFMEASILTLALIPLTFGYAITRYKLMDVELIFKKGAAYVLASSWLLGLYVAIVLLVSRFVEGFSPESGFILFALSAVLVALLFAPLKNRIQEGLDRYFYREQYDYRLSFADFARTLSSEFSLPRLTERITNRLCRTLNVAPVVIFLRQDLKSSTYHVVHYRNLEGGQDRLEALEVPELVVEEMERHSHPILSPPRSEAGQRVRQTLAAWGIHYLQPLRVHERLIGFIGLGKRSSGDFLTSEDLELVSALSGYAAIAVDNALLYRSLESKAGELEQLKIYSDMVIENISLGVVVITPEGEITTWNSSMENIYGLGQQETLGKNIAQIFPPDLIQALRGMVEGPRWLVEETRRLYKTHLQTRGEEAGRVRMVNITLSPFISRGDLVTGLLLVFDNITEKVQLENQLLQAEKLTSIGLFAAGVAHEVNTPLAGISSYAQMLLRETPPHQPQHKILKKIEQQSFRASNIVNNLLNFARVKESDLQEVNINSLMVETLSLLDHQFKKGRVEVKLDLDPSLARTVGNGGRLQQVFMNLFLNAKDAMPRGGELNIKTYQENSTLVVEIHDTGAGIPQESINQIYDPFFTTKDVGKGTGLGLSVSYGIIQEHSGRISVESEPGRGTTFKLRFPVRRIN